MAGNGGKAVGNDKGWSLQGGPGGGRGATQVYSNMLAVALNKGDEGRRKQQAHELDDERRHTTTLARKRLMHPPPPVMCTCLAASSFACSSCTCLRSSLCALSASDLSATSCFSAPAG